VEGKEMEIKGEEGYDDVDDVDDVDDEVW